MDLGIMAMKRYSTLSRAPELEPHHLMQFNVHDIPLFWGWWGLTPLQSAYSKHCWPSRRIISSFWRRNWNVFIKAQSVIIFIVWSKEILMNKLSTSSEARMFWVAFVVLWIWSNLWVDEILYFLAKYLRKNIIEGFWWLINAGGNMRNIWF